jgi:hypothetical protein
MLCRGRCKRGSTLAQQSIELAAVLPAASSRQIGTSRALGDLRAA